MYAQCKNSSIVYLKCHMTYGKTVFDTKCVSFFLQLLFKTFFTALNVQ